MEALMTAMKVDGLRRVNCFRSAYAPTSMSYKLFIPGPIAVSEKTLRAMAQPMIGHRSTDFVALYNSIHAFTIRNTRGCLRQHRDARKVILHLLR
jgi:hypothetical protein